MLLRTDVEYICGSGIAEHEPHTTCFSNLWIRLLWPTINPINQKASIHQFILIYFRSVSCIQFSKWFICLWKCNDFTSSAAWLLSPQQRRHRSPLFSQPIEFQFFYFISFFFVPFIFTSHETICHICHCDVEIHPVRIAVPTYLCCSEFARTKWNEKKNTEVIKGRVWWMMNLGNDCKY